MAYLIAFFLKKINFFCQKFLRQTFFYGLNDIYLYQVYMLFDVCSRLQRSPFFLDLVRLVLLLEQLVQDRNKLKRFA